MSETLATVGLEGAKFNAAVGWFAEERVFKNDFLVDLSVSYEVKERLSDDLNDGIDYMQLHAICAKAFELEAFLIESIAQNVLEAIKMRFVNINEINICIKKFHPPVKAEIAASFVKLCFKK
ncbi:dihydroneopterin aldolase [Pedobacter alpinus]|uniref:Dihydroneopterin aldolase n=1 Tax=Pedobacter alpinus TaxID=1590643 RepID=A0ABW5TY95_9SPHI